MTTRYPTSSWFTAKASAVGALAFAAVACGVFWSSMSDSALREGFSAALQKTTPPAATGGAEQAGSEEYWLSALRPDGPAPVTKTLAVGDRIVMTLSGVERTFEVASVAEFSPEIMAVDTASAQSRLVLVTARDVRNGDMKPIRFVMEIEGGAATVATRRTDRAL